MSPKDAKRLKKIMIQLSMSLQTGLDYFESLSVIELLEVIEEVNEVVSERERVQASNKNSRYY